MALVADITIKERLGAGHFGEVFLAEDAVRGEVAVKQMERVEDESESDWEVRRDGLVSEAQNLAKATHPNVVQVFYCVRSDDGSSVQFGMEFCPGGALEGKFEEGPMLTSAVLRVATEVTLGLQALHQRGMIHRDIKPANILLAENGQAKLGDFGLVTDDLVYGYASGQGYIDHLAVEVLEGGPTSAKTDVWALGMTLYRLLHGREWYSQLSDPYDRILAGGFASSLPWLPHIPDEWRRLIRRMMHDDVDRRYATAEELLGAFGNLPIENEWNCEVAGARVNWSRTKGTRLHTVSWVVHSDRRHEWAAWSMPVGAGKRRRLGGSESIIGRKQCADQLRKFFQNN